MYDWFKLKKAKKKNVVIENNTLYVSRYIFYQIKFYYSDGILKMYNY